MENVPRSNSCFRVFGVPYVRDGTTCERFVVLMYDRSSNKTSINDARKSLFSKKARSLEQIPLILAALWEHVKRTKLQTGLTGDSVWWGSTYSDRLKPPFSFRARLGLGLELGVGIGFRHIV